MKLNEVSLLVALNISQWTARKYDKKATQTVADHHGIYDFVGRYNKALLPMTQSLNDIVNLASGMRIVFYANTLPYTYEGVRLLPSKNYFSFIEAMNVWIDRWNRSVDLFVADYAKHVADAEKLLGDLYNKAEYPLDTEIRGRFKIDLTVSPVPEGTDFYKVLSEDMAKGEVERYIKTMETTERAAMRDCWQRLYGIVQKFVEKLSDESKSLRQDHVQAMLDNAEEMCILLEKLNMTNDPDLEAMRLEVQQSLCAYNAAILSGHDLSKSEVRTKAEEIMKKMDAFMGGYRNGN